MNHAPINDLRSALSFLGSLPGELVETNVEVDPEAELCGVYRHIGAGGTVPRPTKEGPAMIFNSIKGHPDAKIVIGLLASRKRVAKLLDSGPKKLGFLLNEAVLNPIPPVVVSDKNHHAKSLYIRLMMKPLIYESSYLLPPTPPKMPDLILP